MYFFEIYFSLGLIKYIIAHSILLLVVFSLLYTAVQVGFNIFLIIGDFHHVIQVQNWLHI